MMRKHFKKIVILSLFFLLVSGFGIKHAVSKKPPRVNALICMTVTGDITAAQACKKNVIRNNTNQLIVRPIIFNLSYFQKVRFKDKFYGEDCFWEGAYGHDDNLTLAVVGEEDDGTAHARFYFWAYVNDGTTELLYALHMYGTFDGPWPPDPDINGGTTIILDTWEMVSEGRGKLRRVSCTGGGAFSPGTTITVTRTDLP